MVLYTTSSTTTGDKVWSNWVTYRYTTTSTSTASVWASWTNGTSSTTTTSYTTDVTWTDWTNDINIVTYRPVELTKAQKRAIKKAEAKRRAEENVRIAKAKAQEKAREKKARQLLKEVLTEEQNKQLDEKGYFELVSVGSGQRYRIRRGRTRNVEKIDAEGKVVGRLCFHPVDEVHVYDTMVIQKVMLDCDEEAVKRVANYS
jgi:hypothetical protein